MAVQVEPAPISLPLPGGSAGATVRLHPLLTGEIASPDGFMVRKPGRFAMLKALRSKQNQWLPIPAFLVEHPSAGPVLVDTGLHASVAVDPKQSLGRFFASIYKLRVGPEQNVPRRLEKIGLDPASVRTVVMTHLHVDHASGMSEFPDATFVFSRPEWEGATAHGQLRGFVRRQFDHAFDYRTVDYGGGEVSSYASFGRTVDLFGDGSIRLCFTPGHTRGHQSVILRLGGGREALLCGDAAYLWRTIRDTAMPLIWDDEHRFRVSLREIQLYVERNPDALVIPGHDPEGWARLEAAYG